MKMGGIRIRNCNERGHADHGWLNTYHTFSFADYYDPRFESFGSLRVINEDRVIAGEGFGKHPHREFEIFSYVISGELTHRDSMGNVEVISRGWVQFTTAGTGIFHSEYNHNKEGKVVHFLQIWVMPDQYRLQPSYQTKYFDDSNKKGKLCPIVVPLKQKTDDTIGIHQDLTMYACLLDKGQSVTHKFAEGRRGYVHVCMTGKDIKVKLNDTILEAGDGAFITDVGELTISGEGSDTAEFVLFDLV